MTEQDTDDDPDAEELLQQSSQQRRTATEPATSTDTDTEGADADGSQQSLANAVADAYDRIDSGEMDTTIGCRDCDLAALLGALERTHTLEEVVTDAQDALDVEETPRSASKSKLMVLLARIGIRSLNDELRDTTAEGYRQHQQDQDVL